MKNTFIVLQHRVVCWFTKKFDQLDRWLCVYLFRAFRWRWCLLWTRKDEFHPCYSRDHDHEYYLRHKVIDRQSYYDYMNRFNKHRRLAHEADLAESDAKEGDRLFDYCFK